MKQVLVINLNDTDVESQVEFLGQPLTLITRGSGGDVARAQALIEEYDGKVEAIALDGFTLSLQLGSAQRKHEDADALLAVAQETPVVDGGGIRPGLERWGVILADRAQPGIFARKRVLMAPGVNHNGLTQALTHRGCTMRYAEPILYFGLPDVPYVGSERTLDQASGRTLDELADEPFRRIHPQAGEPGRARPADPFLWADIIAGDAGAIRRYAPDELRHKTVIMGHASEDDLADLRKRGVSIAITMMPSLDPNNDLGRWSSAVIEAVLVALRTDKDAELNEDTYLDLMADIRWSPAIRYLQPEEANINRFAFVIHPLDVSFIHKHPVFSFTRFFPDVLVENIAAYFPPFVVSRITGGVSPTTGQQIEGTLISLGATPRQMMSHDANFTYKRLVKAAEMAERRGARLMGLGAFTSVVGDAGITVAHEADIAITTGNSLSVSATLEAAKQAVIKMGATDLTKGKVMIVGATGSFASVCSRLLAQAIGNVVLVSIEPEKLIELKRTIQRETPGAQVTIATKTGEHVRDCDLIVTATSAFGQRIIDLTKCKPGAVICDVARPSDISEVEAALRPDVLVIESGEVLIPGDIDFGYNIGLPPKTAYACLAETALLAMDGRFEDYTLGRNIEMARVKEIFGMFKKHEFQIAGLRSFGKYVTDEDVAEKRALADKLRADSELYARTVETAGRELESIPVMAKGVSSSGGFDKRWIGLAAVGAGLLALLLKRRK